MEPTDPAPHYGEGAGKTFLKLTLLLGLIILFFVVVQQIAIKPYRIPSSSMAPTLQVGDRIIVNKIQKGDIERGSVMVFSAPEGALNDVCAVKAAGPGQMIPCPRSLSARSNVAFVKRVIGLPGDRLTFNRGRVFVNGKLLKEPYAQPCRDLSFCSWPGSIVVPANSYYMLGDNRDHSDDSRVWGPVPRNNFIGPVIANYWPLSRAGKLN